MSNRCSYQKKFVAVFLVPMGFLRLFPARLERSEAVERLERLKLVAAWLSDVPWVTG